MGDLFLHHSIRESSHPDVRSCFVEGVKGVTWDKYRRNWRLSGNGSPGEFTVERSQIHGNGIYMNG